MTDVGSRLLIDRRLPQADEAAEDWSAVGNANGYLQLRRAFALLVDGLGPYLLYSYREIYSQNWETELRDVTRSFKSIDLTNDDSILSSLDTQGHLDLILKRRDAFSNRLGRVGLAYAVELQEARNRLAHDEQFSSDQIVRVYSTVSLLLELIGASDLSATATTLISKIQSSSDQGKPGSAEFAIELREQMALADRTIKALTYDQYKILEWMRGVKRASVSGCAGSGKTLVALEKAIRLEKAGLQVLVLCHNPFLAEHLRFLVSRTMIQVHDFAEWVAHLIDDQQPGMGNLDWINYEEPTEDSIAIAKARLRDLKVRYDAVVVDEGQDFRESWWTLIDCIFADPEHAILYVFHDDNQALLPLRSTYLVREAPFSMSKNCRNAGAVFDIVRQLHRQAPEPSILLATLGTARKTVFSRDFGLAAVEAAIADALSVLSPDRLIVLSTEPVSPKASILDGMSVTVPNRWRWQDAVTKALFPAQRRFGFGMGPVGQPQPIKLPQLSCEPWPTEDDITAVTTFANKLLDRATFSGLPLRNGRGLYWKEATDSLLLRGRPELGHAALSFFASGRWADSLPKPRHFVLGQSPDERISIPVWTTSSFKGLESDGVVLFLRQAQHNFDANVYVAVSRARLYLNIVAETITLSRVPCFSGVPDNYFGEP